MTCSGYRYGIGKMWLAALAVGALACSDDASVTPDDSSSSSGGTTTLETTAPNETSTAPETTAETTLDPDSSSGSSGSSEGTTLTTESTESTGGSSSEGSSTDPSSSSESGVVPMMCPAGELGPAIPETLFGNTNGEDDDFSGSCGGDGAPDVGYTFTAPAAGTYTFDTHGSQLDTVIYVLDGTCSGTELACDDDGDGSQSALAVDLAADQTVTVVVDGNDDGGLPFSLRVQDGSHVCPVADIGSTVPQLVAGDSSLSFNGDTSNCGGAGQDSAYLFTAPATGTYTFDTFGSSFESRIYVRNGVCGGAEIACGIEGVLADLVAGQQVTVTVDSAFGGGAFTLNVDTLGGACPDTDLGNTIPQNASGTTVGGDNTESSTCGGDFSADTLYEFTAPQAGLYQFDTFGSTLDTVLYLVAGSCGGAELDCSDDYVTGTTDSRVIEGMSAGQTVIVGVDGNGVGPYELNVDLVPCPDDNVLGALPQSFSDTTFAGIDKLHGSCGQNPDDESPDFAYSFTAPATGGYTFDTLGTFFDTKLYVLDGAACNGTEIACNDNYQFDQASALSVQLVEDQSVVIVVDGNTNDNGPFTLNVGALDGACPDEDAGNTVPVMLAGSTAGGDNASAGSCGGLVGNDYSYTFTAPADGTYVFNASDSDFDTVVYVRDGGCNGEELDCRFGQFGEPSLAFAALVQDQVVVVTVDGDGAEGDFNLVIDEAPAGGNCCIERMETGCDVPEIEDCVCNEVGDSFCCMVQWDGLCVNEAIDDCGAACI